MQDDAQDRPLRKKTETRARLVAAAAELFAESGSTNVTVGAVCDRAGFTRGAFYSSFTAVDDVFFALYEQQNELVQARLAALVDDTAGAARSVEEDTARILDALPADREWFAVRAAFVAQAAHRPDVAATLREHAEQLRERLQPLLVGLVERDGRRLRVAPEAFARAVIAAHVGAVSQGVLAQDARALRTDTVRGVLLGLTEPQTSVVPS
ncbi:TetR family transcriptional regulator [Sediminihabitans luteus]|uniref:TetR family transcriptional regulator n=1 Tax=Sediminihabitans luteus TaxID=1138585 RepID=A0A2M9CEN2_9CELL|nr:TetR/AcrR family transcriptional regulator [Sediminihabitans luteus]PJJ70406.1 TetR family transcriptional regulator [Sediminihabitans luteus]GII97879.1 TetR family transcriptional regulator [Sediminihabitans luteus]